MNTDLYDDVFRIRLLEGARFDGDYGFPVIERTDSVPDRLISFDKAIATADHNQYVHFFIPDYRFARLWNRPFRYLPVLSKFRGALAVDFSVFWSHPKFVQLESVGRSRTIGSWLQRAGVDTIPVARWGLEDTYSFAFDGIAPGGTVAVGTLGCTKNAESREVFARGIPELLRRVEPKTLVVYGPFREDVFEPALEAGISFKRFASETTVAKGARA